MGELALGSTKRTIAQSMAWLEPAMYHSATKTSADLSMPIRKGVLILPFVLI